MKNILTRLSLVFALLLCAAFAFKGRGDEPSGTIQTTQETAGDDQVALGAQGAQTQAADKNFKVGDMAETTDKTAVSGIPVGEYAFMSVTSTRTDGSANVNTNVNGSLVLKANRTYEHNIYIGNSPGGCGPGNYSIAGDTLTLTPNAATGCDAKGWKYIYDAQINRLSLRDKNVTLLYCKDGAAGCFKTSK